MNRADYAILARAAAERYRSAGRFAHGFALGKLTRDPVFEQLLRRGLLGRAGSVLDLGCGQGLLAALLLAARQAFEAGRWPAQWPAPPAASSLRGLELMPREVERARRALGKQAAIELADIALSPFPPAEVVVILDVLHYLDFDAQADVLARVPQALAPGGRLLLRVGDAGGGLGFRISQIVDHLVTSARGHGLRRLYCRPVADWLDLLRNLGFSVQPSPMSEGTPFANVLLIGDLKPVSPAGQDTTA